RPAPGARPARRRAAGASLPLLRARSAPGGGCEDPGTQGRHGEVTAAPDRGPPSRGDERGGVRAMTEPEDDLRSRLKPALACRLPRRRRGFEDRVAAGVVAAARHEPRTGRPRHEWLLVAATALIAAVTVGVLLARSPALQARPRSQPASRPHGTAAP